jgi:3-oxoadipate enol-lactonase
MWDDQIDALARDYRVVRYDTRGHGRSSASDGIYSLDLLAADLDALLDALDIEKTHLVGLSMGGMISQIFALEYPSRIHTLTLCDTSSAYSDAVAPVWQERIRAAEIEGMAALAEPTVERWFTERFHRASPAAIRRFRDLVAGTSLKGYAGCSEAILQIRATERLNEISVPVLVVVGEHDQGTPVEMAQIIHDNILASELAIIDDSAHFPNVEQPAAFTKVLLEFLDKHPSDG